MPRLIISLISLLFIQSGWAEIRLFACEKDGISILQDRPIENCENLQTFTYQSLYKTPKSKDLRPSEKLLIENEHIEGQLEIERYKQVDESVGDALNRREIDRRNDECYTFKGRIDNALVRIERRPADSLEVRELVSQIRYDNSQHVYYCGAAYPGLESLLGSFQ